MSKLTAIKPSSLAGFTITEQKDDVIISFRRNHDKKEFKLGDVVTNGTQMKGKILSIDMRARESTEEITLFVITSWSGIGMNYESIRHTAMLPSKFEVGHEVQTMSGFSKDLLIRKAEVLKVHFGVNNISYDLEVKLEPNGTVRVYNVTEELLEKFKGF